MSRKSRDTKWKPHSPNPFTLTHKHNKPKSHRMKIGDAVAVVAEPVARVIDFLFGTNLEGCDPCAARRRRWNRQTLWQIIKSLFKK